MELSHFLIRSDKLKPGMVIAQPVLSDTEQVLLDEGITLTGEFILHLIQRQVPYVSVVRDAGNEVTRELTGVYMETVDVIKSVFETVRIFREVPIEDCKDLVANNIYFLINFADILDNLHRIKLHNDYTFYHSLHVAIISGVIGKWMGLQGEELTEIILAGLLHDVGKALVPESILNKPAALTVDEMKIMKMHPYRGYELLAGSSAISQAVKLGILSHHEREDGSGYPDGLCAGDISLYGKITAVADMYDAMSTERVYRKKIPPFTVMEIIFKEMFYKLNPDICFTFLERIRRHMQGCTVWLNDGSKAKVVELPHSLGARPVVRLEDGTLLDLDGDRSFYVQEIVNEMAAE